MIQLTSLLRLIAIVAVGLTLSTTASAITLYRYTDQAGNPVISHTLPQEASQRGYEILTSNGRVIETVPAALTEAQRAAKEAAEQERLAELERQAQQRKADRQLLRSFSHPDDVVRALERKLDQMRSLIKLKEGNIANARSQIRQEQARAADAERSGREIPAEIIRKIETLYEEIGETEAEIAQQEQAIASTLGQYKAKAARVEELTDKKRTKPFPGEIASAPN